MCHFWLFITDNKKIMMIMMMMIIIIITDDNVYVAFIMTRVDGELIQLRFSDKTTFASVFLILFPTGNLITMFVC